MHVRWKTSRHSIFNVNYHLIWCPKYRRRVIVGEVELRLVELLREKAVEMGVSIESLETMPDHVHIFLKANPTLAIQYIVNQFKGYTSRILRTEFEHLRKRMPSLWTRSYYCETIGHISENVIKKYIEAQKKI